MSKKLYLFANWKMYLNFNESKELAQKLSSEFSGTALDDILMTVFPSSLATQTVAELLEPNTRITIGAQNIYWNEKGAYTGEVSAPMYQELEVTYALIGHSERRHIFKETHHEVRLKMEAAINAGLIPVLCVGETENEREKNKTEEVIEVQLRSAFQDLVWPVHLPIIVAYEPVWAIGTGNACDPEEAERVQGLIYQWIETLVPGSTRKVLYGGSVHKDNVASYLKQSYSDGVLVGGASTKIETWSAIVQIAKSVI